jgi:hypothetical protein
MITLSPNPAVKEIKASITSVADCIADWQVIDVAGRVLMQSTTSLKKGSNELQIDLSKLAAGNYYLKIKGTCIDSKTKFQKL